LKDLFYTWENVFDILAGTSNKIANLTIQTGKYTKQQLENALAREFLEKYTKNYKIYEIWEEYAKQTKQAVDDAILKAFSDLIKFKQSYQVWLYKLNGDNAKAIKYQKDILTTQLENLKQELGVANVTTDNYLELMDKAIKASPDPMTIQKWEELGQVLEQVTNLEEDYKKTLQQQATEQASFQEYLLNLNTQVQNQIKSFFDKFITLFDNLSNQAQNFIDNLFSNFSQNVSYPYYLQRFNEVKQALDNAIQNGNTDVIKNNFNELQNIANLLIQSANPDEKNNLLTSIQSVFENYQDIFNSTDNVLKVLLVADESGEFDEIKQAIQDGNSDVINTFVTNHQDELEALGVNTNAINNVNSNVSANVDTTSNVVTALWSNTTAIDALQILNSNLQTYNQNIQDALNDGLQVNWDELWTSPDLYDKADIQAIINALYQSGINIQTQQDLNDWLTTLGNLRFEGLGYFSTLDSNKQQQVLDVLNNLGLTNNLIDNFGNLSSIPNYLNVNYTSDTALNDTSLGNVSSINYTSNVSISDVINDLQHNWSNYLSNAEQVSATGFVDNISSVSVPDLQNFLGSDLYNTYEEYTNLISQGLITDPDVLQQYDNLQNVISTQKNNLQNILNSVNNDLSTLQNLVNSNLGTNLSINDILSATRFVVTDNGYRVELSHGNSFYMPFNYSDEFTTIQNLIQALETYKNTIANALGTYPDNFYQIDINTNNSSNNSIIDNINNFITNGINNLLSGASNIFHFAEGGIINRPTFGLVGEAGYPEAIIPIKNSTIMENLEGKHNKNIEKSLQDLIYLTELQANEIRRLRKDFEDYAERSV